MLQKSGFAAAGLAAALLAAGGCASAKKNEMSGPVVGVPLDLPDHFKVAASGIGKSEEPQKDGNCRNPMVDPRDKALLELRRSANGIGDYWIQSQKYGLGPRQLLRIDCGTGKAIGIVDE